MRGPRAISQRGGEIPRPSNEAVAVPQAFPAPVGGWNAVGPIANMPPTDAIVMDNLYPRTADVVMRGGRVTWSTGLASNGQAFLGFHGAGGGKLFAGTSNGIFDITAGGAVGAAVSTSTSGKFLHHNMATSGGNFLVAVNGLDKLKLYNGTTWTDIDGASSPAITGVTTTDIANLCLFKRRQWFVLNRSMTAYYLPVDSIGGAAVAFPMGPIFNLGGYIVAQANWTLDSGDGADDFLVTVTSEGQAAVYKGTDPASATTFSLVGVYFVGKPIGRRCFTKLGGDLVYISEQGVYALSKILVSSTVDRSSALSYKIDQAFLDASGAYRTVYGWCGVIYQNQNALIFNIPIADSELSYQFVMNNITKAWCRFTGWDSADYIEFNSALYSIKGTKVFINWVGTSDDDAPLQIRVAQAYSRLTGNYQKEISLVRPNIAIQGMADIQMALDNDFIPYTGFTNILLGNTLGGGSFWDLSLWDTATWDATLAPLEARWYTVPNKPGYVHSFRFQLTTSTAQFSWNSTTYATIRAGIL